MKLRKYQEADCEELARLFYETVHSVNAADYDSRQLDAWADNRVDLGAWNKAFQEHLTIVATCDGIIVGFGDMDKSGYLDRLFVHKNFQGQGIATAICDELESTVSADKFTTHASITAKKFFESRGYKTLKKQEVERHGVKLVNFCMEKDS